MGMLNEPPDEPESWYSIIATTGVSLALLLLGFAIVWLIFGTYFGGITTGP